MERPKYNCYILSENNRSLQYIGLIITVVAVFFILMGNAYRLTGYVSIATRILVSFVFLIGTVYAISTITYNKSDQISTLFLLLVILTIVSVIVSGINNLVSHFVSYMCFLMLPAYLIAYSNIGFLGKARNIIFFSNFVYTILFFALSRSPLAHIGYTEYGIGTYISNDLTLGYGNPNETAIYLLVSFIIMFAGIHYKTGMIKLIYFLFTCVLGYLIIQTHCRAGIFLTAICVILKLIRPFFQVGTRTIRIVVLLPIIIAVLVVINPDIFRQIMILGEAAETGRYAIYDSYVRGITLKSILVGDYASYATSNLHNSFLTVFSMFGLPATIVYFRFLDRSINMYLPRIEDSVSYIGLIGVLCLILHGIAEGTLLVAGTVYAGLFSLLILLMIPEVPCEKNN